MLLKLEHDGWASLYASRRGDLYVKLMVPDAVMVLVNGMVMDRDAVVETLNDSPDWALYEITDSRLVPVGPDATALVCRARSARGDEPPFEGLMSRVYSMVDGEPRLALYQQTTITAERSGLGLVSTTPGSARGGIPATDDGVRAVPRSVCESGRGSYPPD